MVQIKNKKVLATYAGIREIEITTLNKKENYHIFTSIEANNDVDDNNDKKAKDCPTCLEKINYELAKCEDRETFRKAGLENGKKEKCFHDKSDFPAILGFKVKENKTKCPKCQKQYVSSKSNDVGDKKTLTHNCSQKPNEEDDDDNSDNNNKIPEKNTVRKYCQDNDIQKLEYDEETGKLIITYKSNKPKSELDNLTEEQEKIKNYLKKLGKQDKDKSRRKFLTNSDWEEDNREYQKHQQQPINWTPWIIAGGIGLFVIVLIAVIGLVRKND